MSKPVLLASPIVAPMCFSADLYCRYEADHHKWNEFPHNFTGHDRSAALKRVRGAGWILHRDRTATCPKCASALGLRPAREPTP